MSVAHHRGILHLDIKPGNILLSRDNKVCLCDWGLSRILLINPKEQRVHQTTFVTLTHRSPELLLRSPLYGGWIDSWSLGVVMVEILMGKTFDIDVDCNYSQLVRIAWWLGAPSQTAMLKIMIRYGTVEPISFPKWPLRRPSTTFAS
jgi:serine/threonine protein kinase